MGRILGLVNGVWATAQERKMHAIRQRFNLYAGGSLSADVRRFFQLINADEVLGTHNRRFPPLPCLNQTGPLPDFQRQYRRKPDRCQRTRVSGRTIVMALSTDGAHRYSWTKNKRSPFVRWTRPLTPRCSTIS